MQSYEAYFISIVTKDEIITFIVEIHENEQNRTVLSW